MASIHKRAVLGLSPAALWEKVSALGTISELLSAVSQSEAHGTKRSCVLADGAQLEEQILGVDHDRQRVAYTITAAPFPLEFHAASMRVEDVGGGRSSFTWITDVLPEETAAIFEGLMESECAQLQERFP